MEATQTAHESFSGWMGRGIEPRTLNSAVRDATVVLLQQAQNQCLLIWYQNFLNL